jgi:hypothetical protein
VEEPAALIAVAGPRTYSRALIFYVSLHCQFASHFVTST